MFSEVNEVATATDQQILDFWIELYQYDIFQENVRPSNNVKVIAEVMKQMQFRKLYDESRIQECFARGDQWYENWKVSVRSQ
jgi:hypothetical protein